MNQSNKIANAQQASNDYKNKVEADYKDVMAKVEIAKSNQQFIQNSALRQKIQAEIKKINADIDLARAQGYINMWNATNNSINALSSTLSKLKIGGKS